VPVPPLQAIRACTINPVENEDVTAAAQRSDPEVQAGQALRRLRLARNWSQDEVAARMTAYGYDFHQTTIAKIEAAQRPLRVRELADFAALYDLDVQDLVYPPTRSAAETDEEISEVTARLEIVQARAAEEFSQLHAAREAEHRLHAQYRASAAEAVALEGRKAALLAARQKLMNWEPTKDSAGVDPRTKRGELVSKGHSVASPAAGPTVLRILLGTQLRRLREARGVTLAQAAQAIRASESKISRMELARTRLREVDVADLLTLYGVENVDERMALLELSGQADRSGWLHHSTDILPTWFQTYLGLEEAVAQISIYEAQHIPGLLQTEDYTRAVTLLGHGDGSTTDTERRVQLLTPRPEVLNRSHPPHLQVLLDEAALRRNVGGPAVMRDQIRHLTEIAEQPNVTIQILPFRADGSPEGSFTIFDLAEREPPHVVCIEQLTSTLYLDKRQEVEEYLRLMKQLEGQALTTDETTQLLMLTLEQIRLSTSSSTR
jgi:transcriptional regulator with XRE-family HTH domain